MNLHPVADAATQNQAATSYFIGDGLERGR
jgi:hypothetical protein